MRTFTIQFEVATLLICNFAELIDYQMNGITSGAYLIICFILLVLYITLWVEVHFHLLAVQGTVNIWLS